MAGIRRQIDLFNSLVFIFPLLAYYEFGVLYFGRLNGADVFTSALLAVLSIQQFLILQVAMVVAFVVMILIRRRTRAATERLFLPVIVESTIYALLLGSLITFVMIDLLGIDPKLNTSKPLANNSFLAIVFVSAGAGIHEEFLFRFIIFGSLQGLLSRVREPFFSAASLPVSLLLSSLAFSLAHHVGPSAEALLLGKFIYRAIAGVFLGLIHYYRGFPVAVYTHAFYDIFVLLRTR